MSVRSHSAHSHSMPMPRRPPPLLLHCLIVFFFFTPLASSSGIYAVLIARSLVCNFSLRFYCIRTRPDGTLIFYDFCCETPSSSSTSSCISTTFFFLSHQRTFLIRSPHRRHINMTIGSSSLSSFFFQLLFSLLPLPILFFFARIIFALLFLRLRLNHHHYSRTRSSLLIELCTI